MSTMIRSDMTVSAAGYDATVDVRTGDVSISRSGYRGEWVGSGRWEGGRIVDCAASLDDSPDRSEEIYSALEPRDPRIPPVGTVLRRVFQGVAHEVTVCSEGFEYAGQRFKTLSAVAKHITGTPWNGFLFFGLKKRVEAAREESAA